jgi:hypothetical protein
MFIPAIIAHPTYFVKSVYIYLNNPSLGWAGTGRLAAIHQAAA